jgi:hypothetical protein
MAGMNALQLKLTPADAELLASLCEQAHLTGLDQPQRQRASQLATYLRYRMSRLWGESRFEQPKPAASGQRGDSPVRSATARSR